MSELVSRARFTARRDKVLQPCKVPKLLIFQVLLLQVETSAACPQARSLVANMCPDKLSEGHRGKAVWIYDVGTRTLVVRSFYAHD